VKNPVLEGSASGVRAALEVQKGFAFQQCFPVCFVSLADRTGVVVRDAGTW
jgi:hypothetical protein